MNFFTVEFWAGVTGVCAILLLANKLWGKNELADYIIKCVALVMIALIVYLFVVADAINKIQNQ